MKKLLLILLLSLPTYGGQDIYDKVYCEDICAIETSNNKYNFIKIQNVTDRLIDCIIHTPSGTNYMFLVYPWTESRLYRTTEDSWSHNCIYVPDKKKEKSFW